MAKNKEIFRTKDSRLFADEGDAINLAITSGADGSVIRHIKLITPLITGNLTGSVTITLNQSGGDIVLLDAVLNEIKDTEGVDGVIVNIDLLKYLPAIKDDAGNFYLSLASTEGITLSGNIGINNKVSVLIEDY